MLGENYGCMMAHLRLMRFFDESLAPGHVAYISGYNTLADSGLKGLFTPIRREVMVLVRYVELRSRLYRLISLFKVRAMQGNEAQRSIPCIIMSSLPEAAVRERITGYVAFVRKPFLLAAMVHLVASVLSSPQPEP